MCAAIEDRVGIIKYLIENGMDVSATDHRQKTALMWAAYKGHTSVVKFLLEQGVDVDVRSQSGKTALMWAILGGRINMVKFLVNFSHADLGIRDNFQKTALSLVRMKKLYSAEYFLSQAKSVGDLKVMKRQLYSEERMELIEAIASRERKEEEIKNGVEVKANSQQQVKGEKGKREKKKGKKEKKSFSKIRAEADLHVEDEGGWTALMWAMGIMMWKR